MGVAPEQDAYSHPLQVHNSIITQYT